MLEDDRGEPIDGGIVIEVEGIDQVMLACAWASGRTPVM